MKKRSLTLLLLCVILLAGTVQAATVVLDDTHAAAAEGSAIHTTTANAFVGNGAWQANGTAKSSYWLAYLADAPRDISISQLSYIGFSTFKTTTGGSAPDWYLTLYTKPDGVNDSASWYGRRLTIEGLYANNLSNPADTWNSWSTNEGTNQLTFFDSNTTVPGFYNAPTLTEIIAGDIDWGTYDNSGSSEVVNYADELILGVVLETGSGWAEGFEGLVDAVTLGAGEQFITFDLEAGNPVPVPGAVWLLGSGLLGLAGLKRKGRK